MAKQPLSLRSQWSQNFECKQHFLPVVSRFPDKLPARGWTPATHLTILLQKEKNPIKIACLLATGLVMPADRSPRRSLQLAQVQSGGPGWDCHWWPSLEPAGWSERDTVFPEERGGVPRGEEGIPGSQSNDCHTEAQRDSPLWPHCPFRGKWAKPNPLLPALLT